MEAATVSVRSCEKIGSQAKAPAPLNRKSLCVNVGQTLPSANPARLPIFSQLLETEGAGAFGFQLCRVSGWLFEFCKYLESACPQSELQPFLQYAGCVFIYHGLSYDHQSFLPPGPVVPWLVYEDVPKAIDWLSRSFRIRGAPAHPARAGRQYPPRAASGRPGLRCSYSGPGGAESRAPSLLVHVEDVDAHYERAKKFGAKVLDQPTTHMFGERQYSAEDFAGRHWTFSQSMADVNPEEWGAKVAKIESHLARLPPRGCVIWRFPPLMSISRRPSTRRYSGGISGIGIRIVQASMTPLET